MKTKLSQVKVFTIKGKSGYNYKIKAKNLSKGWKLILALAKVQS